MSEARPIASFPFSTRIAAVAESVTLAVTARAKSLKAQGIDVVGFGAGEPDFDTPTHIKQAAIDAINGGDTKYQPASGSLALKQAVCDWIAQHGVNYEPREVIITTGGKFALFAAMQALLNEGDEVIIPAPYWVSIPEMVKLAGGKPVIVPTPDDSGFRLTAAQLREAITPRTKIVYLNSPSNPTGTVYTPAQLKALADVIAEHPNIVVFSDEIYEKLVYMGHQFTCFASLRDDLRDRTLIFSGASKTFSMTGWRIGWTAGPASIINAMAKVASQSTSNPTSFCMAATVVALSSPLDFLGDWKLAYVERGQRLCEGLNAIKGIRCQPAGGAFYLFPNVSDCFGRKIGDIEVVDSTTFCQAMLETAHVAMVPGVAFGSEGHVRLSFATSMPQIEKGLSRIAKALAT